MSVALALLVALVLLAALPVLAEWLRPLPDPAAAPGQIARLPRGHTHYQWHGPEDGPVAVCIHGLSTPSYVFAATARSLAAMGFRVLTYDLYGRGFSARPSGPQTMDFFLGQLRALLDDQKVTGPLTVLGYSMGGQIATGFTAEEGRRIAALILAAPSGLVRIETSPRAQLFRKPVIGDWLSRLAGGHMLRQELIELRTTPTIIPDLEDRQAAETRTRGFLPALLSSRRHLLANLADEDHRTVHDYGTPVLAIWGPEDPVIPIRAMGRLAELNPGARHEQVAKAGHNLLQTHPAQVGDALRRFLLADA